MHLGTIITSTSPNYPQDEIIGIYAYDYGLKNPKYKQDFIVNKNRDYREFVLYTNNPAGSSKYVKGIKQFMNTYGVGTDYNKSHHLKYNELPNDFELRRRAAQVIYWAEAIDYSGSLIKPDQRTIEEMYRSAVKIRKSKKSNKVLLK